MLIGVLSQYFFGIAIFISSIFLVLLVLVQRGRGGGLTGALGGPGGQSAFGTKAGDLFTKITVGVAAFWILLCASSVVLLRSRGLPTLGAGTANTPSASGTLEGIGGEPDLDVDIGSPANDLSSPAGDSTENAGDSQATPADAADNAAAEGEDSNENETPETSTPTADTANDSNSDSNN